MGSSFWRRLRHGVWRVRQQPDWAEFVAPAQTGAVMQLDVRDRFHAKQGRTVARWRLTAGRKQLTVYLKRHYGAPWWDGWLAALGLRGRSAAWVEWDHLEWARRHGLPVPRAVAVGEHAGPWGRLESFLAIEALSGMVPLSEAIPAAARSLPPRSFAVWKRGLAAELARLTAKLHGPRHYHKDLYLCHFYVPRFFTRWVPADWEGRVSVIDLHRLGRHPVTGLWWQVKDLAQLLYSSDLAGVTARDRLRFWRAYAGEGHEGGWWHWLRRIVQFRGWRYRRHNAHRKAALRKARKAA